MVDVMNFCDSHVWYLRDRKVKCFYTTTEGGLTPLGEEFLRSIISVRAFSLYIECSLWQLVYRR